MTRREREKKDDDDEWDGQKRGPNFPNNLNWQKKILQSKKKKTLG